jgi:hypothetical protein
VDPVVGSGSLHESRRLLPVAGLLPPGQPTRLLSTAALTAGGADEHSELLVRFASGATAVLWSSLSATAPTPPR